MARLTLPTPILSFYRPANFICYQNTYSSIACLTTYTYWPLILYYSIITAILYTRVVQRPLVPFLPPGWELFQQAGPTDPPPLRVYGYYLSAQGWGEKNHNRKISTRIRIRIHFGLGSWSTISERWIRGSGSTIPKCGSQDPDPR